MEFKDVGDGRLYCLSIQNVEHLFCSHSPYKSFYSEQPVRYIRQFNLLTICSWGSLEMKSLCWRNLIWLEL